MIVPREEERKFWDKHLLTKIQDADLQQENGKIPVYNGSPLRGECFPVELLEKVFQEYISLRRDIQSAHRKMITLAGVCRYWKAVLLSQPVFWSYICVTSFFPTQRNPGLIPLVELWLIRSGSTTPLSLTIARVTNHDRVNQIMDLLLAQVHRWKSVRFIFSDRHPNQCLCDITKGTAEILEDVYLSASNWPQSFLLRIWGALGSSPALRKAIFPRSLPIPTSLLPWHQLTYLTLPGGLPCKVLYSILKNCHCVEQLDIPFPHGIVEQASDSIVLPCLRKLGLFVGPGTSPALVNLKAPVLDSFNLPFSFGPHPLYCLTDADDFLSRSQCSLQTLHISCAFTREDTDTLIPFLNSKNLMQLREVTLSGLLESAMESLLQALIVQAQGQSKSPILLPSLSKLTLGLGEKTTTLADGLVGEMLMSRMNTGNGLKEAYITVARAQHGFVRDKEMAGVLREMGLILVYNINEPLM
ncbi:hypothetical protein AX16_001348 [Volvariella volvacea WC 439]|nr:hypothetical protein AX16_001348 [Volvariella volvacea WC 439]